MFTTQKKQTLLVLELLFFGKTEWDLILKKPLSNLPKIHQNNIRIMLFCCVFDNFEQVSFNREI